MSNVGARWYDDKESGTFMCCICFNQVKLEDAWTCSHGDRWDNCADCGERNGCFCEQKVDLADDL